MWLTPRNWNQFAPRITVARRPLTCMTRAVGDLDSLISTGCNIRTSQPRFMSLCFWRATPNIRRIVTQILTANALTQATSNGTKDKCDVAPNCPALWVRPRKEKTTARAILRTTMRAQLRTTMRVQRVGKQRRAQTHTRGECTRHTHTHTQQQQQHAGRRAIDQMLASFKQYTGLQMCRYFKRISIVLASAAMRIISTS